MSLHSLFRFQSPKYAILDLVIRFCVWLRYGRKYSSPVRPDRIVWADPCDISHKPVQKPTSSRVLSPLIAGGEWDRALERVDHDDVYKSFYERFEENKHWRETGYVAFLTTEVSEHEVNSEAQALERCRKMDRLYRYIDQNGYRCQRELESENELIGGLTNTLLPPEYREIAVDITRDGEFVWHAGMHRLVIAQLLELDQVPVRVHIRHQQWQEIRDAVYTGTNYEEYMDHPDVRYLV